MPGPRRRSACGGGRRPPPCVPIRLPVSHSSSKRLGVAMSATASAWSRYHSGMPARTYQPGPNIAHDRIAAIERPRVGLLDPGDDVEQYRPDLGVAEIARQHRVAARQHAQFGDALEQAARFRSPAPQRRAICRSRCGLRTRRCSATRSRSPAAATGTAPRNCRHCRRRPRIGPKERSACQNGLPISRADQSPIDGKPICSLLVTPCAKAGRRDWPLVQARGGLWVPAFAGTTGLCRLESALERRKLLHPIIQAFR